MTRLRGNGLRLCLRNIKGAGGPGSKDSDVNPQSFLLLGRLASNVLAREPQTEQQSRWHRRSDLPRRLFGLPLVPNIHPSLWVQVLRGGSRARKTSLRLQANLHSVRRSRGRRPVAEACISMSLHRSTSSIARRCEMGVLSARVLPSSLVSFGGTAVGSHLAWSGCSSAAVILAPSTSGRESRYLRSGCRAREPPKLGHHRL